ncbi:uncharacterized protein FIESC28_06015 [Fusarium coffeatum]|uniref:Uncharacterized protein n=1 Tax=Fusarium coffeatum TaxID=231269 RepID=A0A366RQ88_9HYPO|nr:uncharacterized protein FIESC28_06015 [Fusarium coffeatum]RBR18560.1 hypothetical protein FIESC28_06015 [Fusarium coffeatum]
MKITLTKEQEREIYIAYKKILHGQDALLRREKPIEQRIIKTKDHSSVRDVLQKYDRYMLVQILRELLSAKVFESEERANIYFSSVPPTPPTAAVKQTAAPVASEMETKGVAFTNLDQLLGISSSTPELGKDETMGDGTNSPPTSESSGAEEGGDKKVCPSFTCSTNMFPVSIRKSPVSWAEFLTLYTRTNDRNPRTPPTSSYISSDISSDLSSDTFSSATSQSSDTPQSYEYTIVPQEIDPPHRTQILILSRMQRILEAACFEYAEDMMPNVLKEMGWTCPEAGELNIWACHLRKRTAILEHRAAAYGIKIHISTILSSCVNIRHFAVHRKELHAAQLVQLTEHAVTLCTILGTPEHEYVYTLQRIRDAIKDQLSSLAMLKRQFATGLVLGRITECRKELLAMEQEVLNWAAKRRTELDVMEQESIRSSRVGFDQQKAMSWDSVEALLSKNETPLPVETQAIETQASGASDADSHIRPDILQGGRDELFEGTVSCFPLFPTLEACQIVGQILRWVVTKAWSVTLITAESLSQNTWISVFWMAVFFMVLLGLYCMGLVYIVRMAHI